VEFSRGKDVGQIFRVLGSAEKSCYRWRKNKRLEIEPPLFQVIIIDHVFTIFYDDDNFALRSI
jgi:hypothetical protein